MKKLSLIAAALALASSSAFAVDLGDSFNVTINFTSTCTVKTAASDLVFNYTAFGAAQSGNTTTVFQCSRGLTPTFSFDDTGVDQTGATGVALGTSVAGQGVIGGVRYTLAGATSRSQTGADAAAGAGGVGGSNGTADEYTVGITANIPGNQAGIAGAVGGTHVRTLTMSY